MHPHTHTNARAHEPYTPIQTYIHTYIHNLLHIHKGEPRPNKLQTNRHLIGVLKLYPFSCFLM